ncbi:HNH endonuclease signature motif containing protein [Paenibacillus sp. NPDC056933]|uniref:HNH endonuclease signature motif containing protein n=1 Tax=Paenibacillus sp. NPDC056933 TaxID=3345968 RepID=UPI0036370B02
MNKFKNGFLGFLAAALILGLSPVSATAAQDNNEITVQQVEGNNEIAFVEPLDSISKSSNDNPNDVNPNEIKEVQYLLSYNNATGVQSTRLLEPNETIETLDSVTPLAQGGVVYGVLLTPIDGAAEADISFRINGFVGSKPNRIDLTYTLFRGVQRGTTGTSVGGCTASIQGILNVKEGKTVVCNKKISQTGYYFGKVDLNIKNALGVSMGTDSSQTRQILTNKRATVYPHHYDPYSNKTMAEPARTDWARTASVTWGKTERGVYIKKYSELYPSNGWNWDGAVTHIHHVRPREYGGTNAFDNLIPIPARVHESIVSPWFTGY